MQSIDSTFLPTTFEIHWLSVVNSFVLVLLLTFFLAVILMRILKNDFSKYMEIDEEELSEEVGIYCFCTVCMYVWYVYIVMHIQYVCMFVCMCRYINLCAHFCILYVDVKFVRRPNCVCMYECMYQF